MARNEPFEQERKEEEAAEEAAAANEAHVPVAQKKMAAVTASDMRACAAQGSWKEAAGLLGKKALRPVAATTRLLFSARASRSST